MTNLDISSSFGSFDKPELTAIAPDTGTTTPGSNVTVHGSGFVPGAIVYFCGLQARETNFISASTLEVVTPYLRPGPCRIQIKSGDLVAVSDVIFNALPSRGLGD